MGVHRNFSRKGSKYFRDENFEINGTRTTKSAENKKRTAQSVNILICFKFLKVMLIVSYSFIVKN